MRDDLISRKTAIEEMLKCGEYYNGNDEAKRGVAQCIGVIHELPSAQPEERTEERTETHACDSISRRAAIDAVAKMIATMRGGNATWCKPIAESVISDLPSVQPERLTDDDFETIRIHLNAYKEKLCNQQRWKEAEEYQRIIDRFMAFASAQPENRMERDVISRQAAIKAFKDFLTIHDSRGVEYLCPAVTMDGVNKILSDLPSAQPERKTGRWMLHTYMPHNKYCSCCEKDSPYGKRWSFCPNCGAYMGGENDG